MSKIKVEVFLKSGQSFTFKCDNFSTSKDGQGNYIKYTASGLPKKFDLSLGQLAAWRRL